MLGKSTQRNALPSRCIDPDTGDMPAGIRRASGINVLAHSGGRHQSPKRARRRAALRFVNWPGAALGAALATTRQGLYDVQGIAEGPHIVRTGAGHSFEVHVSQDALFDIELPPISLAGVVRSARTRQPVPHSWVEIKRDDGYRKALVTDADGYFRFAGLAAGGYVVTVSGLGFERRSRNVTVAGREVVEMELAEAESGSGMAGHEGQQ